MNHLTLVLILCFSALCLQAGSVSSSTDRLQKAIERIDGSPHMRYYHWFTPEGKRMALLNAMRSDPELRQAMEEEPEQLGLLCPSMKRPNLRNFPCKPFRNSTDKPTSVHALSPADIEVVGAMGDSLSAGTGINACTVLGLLVEYRGHVFSIGGDSNVEENPTLANFLRQYNPNLIGFSTGRGGYEKKNAHFNVANPGDNSLHLMPQAEYLVNRMRQELTAEQFTQSWKLVTIFIGNNDICEHCKEGGQFTPQLFKERLQTALDYLQAHLPRTLVNLVTLLDTALVHQLNKGLVCSALHFYECKCAAYPKDVNEVLAINNAFQHAQYELIQSGRYDSDEQYTVVVQPFFQNTTLPQRDDGSVDLSYFAPDCFHFSAKGHAATALALWNAMFEPVGLKKLSWHIGEPFECPDVNSPYIRTAKN